MKIREILQTKGSEVFSIGENNTILEAINVLVKNRIGAVLVLNSEAGIAGILSERDVVRSALDSPGDHLNKHVKDVMTKNIIFIEPNDDIEYVQSIMTGNHIRHLPVVENKALCGIISIGDIIKSLLTKTQYENKYLQDYISGNLV